MHPMFLIVTEWRRTTTLRAVERNARDISPDQTIIFPESGGAGGACETLVQGQKKRKRGEAYIEPCLIRHHALKANPHALNHSQEDAAHDGSIPRRLEASSHRQRPTRQKPCDDFSPC